MSMVEIRDLVYYYTEGRRILDGVNMTLEKGMMYAIVGPSGCGKSTLLSLIGGLDVAKGGQILFEGEDASSIGLEKLRRDKVSFVFQNYNLIDYLTPVENVLLTAKEDPMPMLERLGLTPDEARRNVLKLSGGQQQRVAIARALASQNPVILADEPTGNLDEDTAMEITAILKDAAKKQGRCVVIVSHSSEVAAQADIVFALKGGALREHSATDGPSRDS